jgi:hypothetical protein
METLSNLSIFNIIAGSASILSLVISLVALKQVYNIKSKIKQKIKGNQNIQSGRDSNV